MKKLFLLILFILWANTTFATTYYVRTDGGNDTDCNGQYDASAASTPNCAWAHPHWALKPGTTSTMNISGGDTLIIGPGSYEIGYGSGVNVGSCSAGSEYLCDLPSLPDGTSGAYTKIYGAGWDTGCSSPPELWGSGRIFSVIRNSSSDYTDIRCLNLTDHVESAYSATTHPNYIDWSDYTQDNAQYGFCCSNTTNWIMRDVNIHGFHIGGILNGGTAGYWDFQDVQITGNSYVGINMDVNGGTNNDPLQGTFLLDNVDIKWNGCPESYPEGGGFTYDNCYSQSQSGYGDGIGTDYTGTAWTVINSDISHNTSDGLDLLYKSGGSNTVKRSLFEGNAGNQVKTRGTTLIENSVIISNCNYFSDSSKDCSACSGSFDDCRSGGNAISWTINQGAEFEMYNSTVWSEGDVVIMTGSGSTACDGSEVMEIDNDIIFGAEQWNTPSDKAAWYYCSGATGSGDSNCCTGGTELTPDIDYSIVYNVKSSTCPSGTAIDCTDPNLGDGASLVEGFNDDAYDMTLTVNSTNAIDSADEGVGVSDANDFLNIARGASWDIGAYEYEAGAPAPTCSDDCSLCSTEYDCESSAATNCSGGFCCWYADSCNETAQEITPSTAYTNKVSGGCVMKGGVLLK